VDSRTLALRIELLSDASPGTGTGQASTIDREVPHTSLGLPFLPGRRVKGLLRDAAMEIHEMDLADPAVVDQLFGTERRPGAVRVGNAELESAEGLVPWVTWASSVAPQDFGPEQVLRHYAYLRQQTAINRRTGAPLEQTLRRVRVLKRGLRFRAPILVSLEPERLESAVRTLALAGLAIRRFGVSRNRGLGHVRCELYEGEANLSTAALGELGWRAHD
jgi:CRISPR-associated protein Csx10